MRTMRIEPPRRLAHRAGFSVLELIVVLAVSTLMGSVAVSAYRTYTVRSQVSVGLIRAESIRGRVTAAFTSSGDAPADRRATGLRMSSTESERELIESIDVVHGRIGITFSSEADAAIAGRTLYLTPFETADGNVVWICGHKAPGVGLEPLGFAAGRHDPGHLPTTIEPRFLPSSCR